MNRVSIVLTVGCVAGAATSLWLWQQLREQRAAAETLQGRVADLDRAPSTANSAIPALDEMPDQLSARATPLADTAIADESHDENEYARLLFANSRYRAAWRASRLLELEASRTEVARSLGISETQAGELFGLLVDQELAAAEPERFDPANLDDLMRRRAAREEELLSEDGEISARFGTRTLARWKEYQETRVTRAQVNELRVMLAATDAPLQDEQARQLVSALHPIRQGLHKELAAYTETLHWSDGMEWKSHQMRNARYLELAKPANTRMLEVAAGILSRPQLSQLDSMLRLQLARRDAQFSMQRALSEMSVSGELPPAH